MTTAEFWALSKEERAWVREKKWEKFLAEYCPKPTEPEPVHEPVKSESLSVRFPATVFIQSADEILEAHKHSISKFNHAAIYEDIRSFGQSEFERGIMFAMQNFNI